jgi:hypothetical protein
VRHPFVDVPVATYTGWNPRIAEIGFGGIRTSFAGSYIPWPRVKVLDRYATRTQYLGLFTEAALKMMNERFLTADDLPQLLRDGAARWEYATREQ